MLMLGYYVKCFYTDCWEPEGTIWFPYGLGPEVGEGMKLCCGRVHIITAIHDHTMELDCKNPNPGYSAYSMEGWRCTCGGDILQNDTMCKECRKWENEIQDRLKNPR
jgi:hypothetical protein